MCQYACLFVGSRVLYLWLLTYMVHSVNLPSPVCITMHAHPISLRALLYYSFCIGCLLEISFLIQEFRLISNEISRRSRESVKIIAALHAFYGRASMQATYSHPLEVSNYIFHYCPKGSWKACTQIKGTLYFTHIRFTKRSIQGCILFNVCTIFKRIQYKFPVCSKSCFIPRRHVCHSSHNKTGNL